MLYISDSVGRRIKELMQVTQSLLEDCEQVAKEKGFHPADFDNINTARHMLSQLEAEWKEVESGLFEPDILGPDA